MNNMLRLAVVGLLVLLAVFCFRQVASKPVSELPGQPNEDPAPTAQPAIAPDYVSQFIKSGWDRQAAESVVELNREWFTIQAEENPLQFEYQLKLLQELGKHSELQGFIAEHPETAGLLAMADNPLLIADGLKAAGDDYQIVAGLYVQHVTPSDANDIALALKTNRDSICNLQRRGLTGSEVLFILDRKDPADDESDEYEKWLRESISDKSAASDDEFAAFVNLVLRQGRWLRDRLRNDDAFRKHFRSELWPRLVRALDGQRHEMLDLFVNEKRIWDLLALENGEELLKRCGLLPIDLLFGGDPTSDSPPYSKDLHEKIVQILLRREALKIQALVTYQRVPLFHTLLRRDLSSDTLSAAMKKLLEAGPNYPELLAHYDGIQDNAVLAEEVGPPPAGLVTWVPLYYTVYEVPRKILQGRDPTGMDLFQAAVDPVFIVLDVFSFGSGAAGRKGLIRGGKEVTEKAVQKMTEKGVTSVFVTTVRDTGLEFFRKQLGKDIAETIAQKELADWTVTGGLSRMIQSVRTAAGKATTVEITGPIQFMFRHGGVGRETWKHVTGMEARLFMRGDAKVFVRLSNLPGGVVGNRIATFFERTTQDLTIGAAVENEIGQDVLQGGARHIVSAKDQMKTWQRNVSAWWLLNASRGVGEKIRDVAP